MTTLTFETLSFQKKEAVLQVTLLNLFTTEIPLNEMPEFNLINSNTIEINEKKFSLILTKYFTRLKNKLTGNKATYIYHNSGIPLIGNVAFGIVYRDSSIIEIKPVTSCNLNCVYCSLSEGLNSQKNDFVVEKDYLIAELKQLLAFVEGSVEVHVGVQGEPFLYADLEPLIADLQQIENVCTISVDTNGTLLNRELIDSLAKNTKLQLNISLDTLDEEKAKKIAGVKNYNLKHVQEMIAFASEKIKVIVAPVLISDWNEQEMDKIICWIKTLKKQPALGIQNFLKYKTGRKAGEELSWEIFYRKLTELEQKHDLKLKLDKEDFQIRETKELPKPFLKDKVVSAVIKAEDRFPGTVVAAAQGRNISVPDCKFVPEKKINLKIIRDKHNIFVGRLQ